VLSDGEHETGEEMLADREQETGEIDCSDMDQVIQSEAFREELQEMIAEQMSNNLIASHQPLSDILSLRQRFCKTDGVSMHGTGILLQIAVCYSKCGTFQVIFLIIHFANFIGSKYV